MGSSIWIDQIYIDMAIPFGIWLSAYIFIFLYDTRYGIFYVRRPLCKEFVAVLLLVLWTAGPISSVPRMKGAVS